MMLAVSSNSWALMLGMLLLMLGNGLHVTLLGVRGEIEQFSTFEMSVVMSAYLWVFWGRADLCQILFDGLDMFVSLRHCGL